MTLQSKLITVCAHKVSTYLLSDNRNYYSSITDLTDYTSDLCFYLLQEISRSPYEGIKYKVIRAIRANNVDKS